MNRAGVIKAAYFAAIAMDETPSARVVQEFAFRICGKRLRPADIASFLREQRQRETLGKRGGNGAETPTPRESSPSGNVSETGRNPLHARTAKVQGQEEAVVANATPETVVASEVADATSSATTRAKRTKPTPKPLPEIPPDFADDVERLAANDASDRADGRLSEAIHKRLHDQLRRAFERQARKGGMEVALAALDRGIQIALDKGLGLAYAAGCVRRFNPDRDMPREGSIRSQSPGLFAGANLPDSVDPQVFRRYARPGEDYDTLKSRLYREDPTAFKLLHRLPLDDDERAAVRAMA